MSRVLLTGNSDIVIYNFRFEFVEELIKQGHEVIIVAPYGPRIEFLKEVGCEYEDIHIDRHGTNPIAELKLIKEYKRIINKTKPDIVFSYTIKPNLYCAIACREKNIPIVVTITGLGTAVEYPGWKQLVTIALYKYAFTDVKKIFFQNEENKQFFINHKIADESKYEVVPGSGVNLEKFKAQPYPNDKVIKFLFASRIMKEKGIDLYIEAAKQIKKEYPNTEFIVCGFCEDDYQKQLEDLTKQGITDYRGMIMDMRDIYKEIHCLVFPSYYPEGMSNVLLEAAASARPIITTNRSGCVEIVDNKITGYIVEQRNSKELLIAIKKIISLNSEDRIEMGNNSRKYITKKFNREIVINKYIRLVNRYL